jgi:hypothetical protein
MEKAFDVELGKRDRDHDIVLPSAFKNLPQKVVLLDHFDVTKALGMAEVFLEGNEVKANITLARGPVVKGKEYGIQIPPGARVGIGYQIISSEIKEDGHREIQELKLYCASLI